MKVLVKAQLKLLKKLLRTYLNELLKRKLCEELLMVFKSSSQSF